MFARARNLTKTLGFSKKDRRMATPTITRLVADEESSSVAPADSAPPPAPPPGKSAPPAPPPCPLCDAILAAFALPLEHDIDGEFELDLADLDRDCPHNAWLKTAASFTSISESERLPHGLRKIRVYRDMPGTRSLVLRILDYDGGVLLRHDDTKFAELVRRRDVDGHPGTARVLDPAWIDLDVVRSWYARCPRDHGPECDVTRIPGTDPIRPRWLIDVEQSCIVPGSSSDPRQENGIEPHYLALSYTWGVVDNVFRTCRGNLAQVRTPGALLSPEVACRIPATVRDTITLTRELGERYLWVDSLCIVQDDEQMLRDELRQMHRIYSSAFLTIVVKDGQDASAGLSGIRGISALPRRAEQIIIPLSYGEQLSMVQRSYFSSEIYNTRMWTFQEEMFAQRQLVFTYGRAEWECPRASWREHLEPHIPSRQHAGLRFQVAERMTYEWMATGLPDATILCPLVIRFNRRVLTNEADCLNAFSGIQTALGHIYTGGSYLDYPSFSSIFTCSGARHIPGGELLVKFMVQQGIRTLLHPASCPAGPGWVGTDQRASL
ncbi:HET domain-containing protein [Microdochium nivale]|nr:HET domain-containing protein [Microdochium nivale]